MLIKKCGLARLSQPVAVQAGSWPRVRKGKSNAVMSERLAPAGPFSKKTLKERHFLIV
jgi:hypothetical protein